MKLLTDWGFSAKSWQGARGEYWVASQVVLIVGYAFLPVYSPVVIASATFGRWVLVAIAASLGLVGIVFFSKGLWDLGKNLTPLPYPREDGSLIQTGLYSLVRHPLYSGFLIATLGWGLYWLSLTHLLATLLMGLFFNAKADREEAWLMQRYSDYVDYRQRVKKLIPWVY